MCGLIGVATKNNFGFSHGESKVAQELLFMDTLRGEDSTGVCLVKNTGEVSVVKKATWAPAFMCSKAFQELDAEGYKKGKVFMGHNRKATVGDVTSENAHPFIVNDEFVLMHNGSLPTHKHLADTKVDSEAIAIYLHEHWKDDDTSEDKAKVLAKISGAWCLVFYDLRTEKLNIVRNSQRPMNFAVHNGTLVWASDEHMLKTGLSRNGMPSQEIKVLPAYTLLTFDGTALLEVALPTAPFFPSVATASSPIGNKTGTKSSGPTAATGIEGSMSKNSFKKFIRYMEGKKINFNLEDYVDVNGLWHFYGDKTEWEFSHEITGMCKDDTLLSEVLATYGMAQGVIDKAVRDKETGHVRFYVTLSGVYENAEATACH